MNSVYGIILILILAGIISWLYDWFTLPHKIDITNTLLKEILEEFKKRE